MTSCSNDWTDRCVFDDGSSLAPCRELGDKRLPDSAQEECDDGDNGAEESS